MGREGLGVVFSFRVWVLLFSMGMCFGSEVLAQDGPSGVDQRLLAWINGSDSALLRSGLGAVDYTAYPSFYGAIPIAWIGPSLSGKDSGAATRLTGSMVGAYGLVMALKLAVGRDRPNVAHSWVRSRPEYPGGSKLDPNSWPSGHSALAAAMATSLALTYRSGFVVVPAVLWAGGVGLSRVWLGVHYPSDVVAGWVLGAAVAIAVHALSNNRENGSFQEGPLLRLSIPF